MLKTTVLLILSLFFFLSGQAQKKQKKQVRKQLKSYLAEYNIPALACAVLRSDGIELIEAAGVRNIDSPFQITTSDRFHLGSNTKALTAFWAALLVDDAKIDWKTPFFELFPEWKLQAQEAYHEMTLADLLSHRARIPAFMSGLEFSQLPKFNGQPHAQRLKFSEWVLAYEPVREDTIKGFDYSNAGYALATIMLERASGQTWETAMSSTVLAELGASCGFGWPIEEDKHQPCGHMQMPFREGELMAQNGGAGYRLPPSIAPAGDLNMSVRNYARFIQVNLQGLRGENRMLQAKTFDYLHYGRKNYAMGWLNWEADGVHISSHDGSAGTFYAHSIIYKEKDLAIIILANASTKKTVEAVYALRDYLLKLYDD